MIVLFLWLFLRLLVCFTLVPMAGVEPARLAPLPPQDSVSTNSTTSACALLVAPGKPHNNTAYLRLSGTTLSTRCLATLACVLIAGVNASAIPNATQ